MYYFAYGVGFFILTLIIQYLLHKLRKNKNKQYPIWAGTSVVTVVALTGIFTKNPAYLGAVIGYVTADKIGKELGWH